MLESSDGGAKSTLYCSFCGKSQHEVRKLIAGPQRVHLQRVRRAVRRHHQGGGPQDPQGVRPDGDDAARDQGGARRLRDRAGAGQAGAVGRGAQPLQAPGARLQGRRGRARQGEHPADRADRLRQDAARADPRAHAGCAVRDGGRDHADRGRLRRRGRRERHPEAAAGRRLRRRARAARHRLHRRGRQDRAQVRRTPRSPATSRARACSRRCSRSSRARSRACRRRAARKHPQQELIQVDTTNILFICGGAFNGLERIIGGARALALDGLRRRGARAGRAQDRRALWARSSRTIS